MKRKSLLIFVLSVMTLFSLKAQSVSSIMNDVLLGFKNVQNLCADFELSTSQFKTKGSIIMSGVKFRILTNDFKSWYDGRTQWIYTTLSNEVNIIEPTADELRTSNPYFAIMDYSSFYNAELKSKGKTEYIVEFNAKNNDVDISKLVLTIDANTYRIIKAVVTMAEGGIQILQFGNYAVNKEIANTTFAFDEKLVPKGTQLIDLR